MSATKAVSPESSREGRVLEEGPPALVTAEASAHPQFCAVCAFSSPWRVSKSPFSELQR